MRNTMNTFGGALGNQPGAKSPRNSGRRDGHGGAVKFLCKRKKQAAPTGRRRAPRLLTLFVATSVDGG